MAKKENRWVKSERVGQVTLYLCPGSPYWQMYWLQGTRTAGNGKERPRERRQRSETTQ